MQSYFTKNDLPVFVLIHIFVTVIYCSVLHKFYMKNKIFRKKFARKGLMTANAAEENAKEAAVADCPPIPNGTLEEEDMEEQNGAPELLADDDELLKKKKEDVKPTKKANMKADAPKRRSPTNYSRLLKYVSLFVLVLQNTSQVLVMRYATTRDRHEHPPFLKTVAVFFNEVVKFVAALVLFFASTNDFRRSLQLLRHHFFFNFLDTLKVGVPSFIYVVQNFLLYVAVEHLDAGTYMVTYQLKILTTALFTVLMLKRKLSIPQWIALVILIGGVAIVQYSANQKSSTPILQVALDNATALSTTTMVPKTVYKHEQSPILGFIAVIVACFLSGFAGIYFEKILKGSNVSVWLRNVQLAALSIPIGFIVIGVKDGQRVHEKGFMQGFDYVVWIVVLLQALGGLVVAVVIKYADNILKAFATSVSIVVATVASIFIFATYPSLLFVAGAALVISAVALYGTFPYRKRERAQLDEEEGALDGKGEELQVIVKKEVEEDKDEEQVEPKPAA